MEGIEKVEILARLLYNEIWIENVEIDKAPTIDLLSREHFG